MLSKWTTYDVNPICENDIYHDQFEIFGILVRPGVNLEAEPLLNDAAIVKWLTQSTTTTSDSPSLRLLCTRHRDLGRCETKAAFRAFTSSTFTEIENDFSLPSAYTQIRTHASASGAFLVYPTREDADILTKLGFVIRVPHSPNNVKSTWSLGASYDPSRGTTSALFDGLYHEDMKIVIDYINFHKTQVCHPMFLPLMIVELLLHFDIARKKRHSRTLYELAGRLGVTHGRPRQFSVQDISSSELEFNTVICNRLVTGLVYQERKQHFLKSTAGAVARRLDCPPVMNTSPEIGNRIEKIGGDFQDTVSNCLFLANEQISVNAGLQKRTNNLLNVINVLIAQRDTRATIELTKSAKLDSSAMTAIAVLTMIFLPATFVSSFFGMNFFVYNTSESRLVASGNLWIFAASTLPLTLLILSLWASWVRLRAVKLLQDPLFRPMSPEALSVSSSKSSQLADWQQEMTSGPVYDIPSEPILEEPYICKQSYEYGNMGA